MKEVQIYTDGACRGNPGHGGWGTILVYGKYEKELSGGEKLTTNNRMELLSVIKGIEAIKEKCNQRHLEKIRIFRRKFGVCYSSSGNS